MDFDEDNAARGIGCICILIAIIIVLLFNHESSKEMIYMTPCGYILLYRCIHLRVEP